MRRYPPSTSIQLPGPAIYTNNPNSRRHNTTLPDSGSRSALLRHTRVGTQFYDMPWSHHKHTTLMWTHTPLSACHSYTDDHRGQLIAYVISNSDHITHTPKYQTSWPYITTTSNTLYNRISWTTQHALSSDHLPIISPQLTYDITTDYSKTDELLQTTRKKTWGEQTPVIQLLNS